MDNERPTLITDRLVLRPFTLSDAPAVQQLAGAREVARTTLLIPHPYPDGAAEAWIQSHEQASGDLTLAVTLREETTLIGAVGLNATPEHERAEIGYWIGVPYWNRGYGTEAAGAVMRWAFETRRLNRVFALHFVGNPASGRIMQKLGMRHEGTLRQHIVKWGERIDVEVYGILREEWARRS